MTTTGGQQLEEVWSAGGRAGGWVGGKRQVARAHAIPQGGKSRVRGGTGRVRIQSALRLSLFTMTS